MKKVLDFTVFGDEGEKFEKGETFEVLSSEVDYDAFSGLVYVIETKYGIRKLCQSLFL